MIDRSILAEHGVTVEAWKKIFALPKPKGIKGGGLSVVNYEDEKIQALAERVRARCQAGRDQCTSNFRTIRALDLIWDAPYRQVSPTLLWNIAETCKTTDSVEKALTMYGFDLASVLVEEKDPKSGNMIKKLNAPLFFAVTIPLVHSMLNIRKAKIVNDRNRPDFFDYPPAVNTRKNRLKCSAAKSRMRLMAQQYSYVHTLDQAVHQMLLYPSGALMFTQENWHWEEQLRRKKVKKDEKKETKKKAKDSDYESYVTKEGLRYFIPHPARTFGDRSHPWRTFNTETGCDWGGHWKVMQWKELRKNPDFWNLEKVSSGDSAWWSDNAAFLNVFFSSCVIAAPTITDAGVQSRNGKDRDAALSRGYYYGVSEDDKSVALYEYRERLVPKDEGLGDYPHPIWARFVCAGDGTIVYAEPLCYRAILSLKDNGDETKTEDASMGLKLAPFQDQLSNLISQYILSVKQNLAQITLMDENVFGAATISKLANKGENWFRSLNIETYDSKKTHKQRDNIGAAIFSHRFPQIDTNSILMAARTVVELAERVLNFSSQELGQAASHEQSAAEQKVLGITTSNVLQYTSIPVDSFMHAWGSQVYEAWWNEGDDQFDAEVPYEEDVDKKLLEEMGFTFVDEPDGKEGRAHIKGKKSKTMADLLSFSMLPNSSERKADADVARVISEMARDMLNNPTLAAALGPDQAVALYNTIVKYMDLPIVPLKNTGLTPEKQAEQAKEQLSQLVDQVKAQFAGEIEGKLLNEVKQALVPMLQRDEDLTKKVDAIWQVLQLPPINGNPQAPDPAAGGPPAQAPGMAPPIPMQ